MLQSSFNLIRQHFSPNSPIDKNIFITKDYDYPTHFIQRLYISYLQLQQTISTASTEQIAKRINLVANKSDASFQNTILGIIYGIILHAGKIRLGSKKPSDLQRLSSSQKSLQSMEIIQDAIKFSQQILKQIKQLFPLFRAQAWNLLNSITINLIMNHFKEIKPCYRFGFIMLFQYLQQFESCSDNFFILLMKTINFYDQSNGSIRYNLQLLDQLNLVLRSVQQKGKSCEQVSLMRLYFFGKLGQWQYLANKMRCSMKSEWPYYLQKLSVQGLRMFKQLYKSNPQQCLVFSAQLIRYSTYSSVSDLQLQQIHQAILRFPPIKSQMLTHHYSLLPLSIEMMLPFQVQECLGQLQYTMASSGNQGRVERASVLTVLGWMWRELGVKYAGETMKSYLLENILPDIVRWALTSVGKNIEFRSILIQWAMYQCPQNQALNKLIRITFFQDIFYYLKHAQKINLQQFFPILTIPFFILNYYAFYSPHLAEQLFLQILGKVAPFIPQYQPHSTPEAFLRSCINDLLDKANTQSILRVTDIIYHSQVGNYIKNQLQLRIKEVQQSKSQLKQREKLPQQKEKINESYQKIKLYQKPEVEYYGAKDLQVNLNFNSSELGNVQQQEDDILYSSHELIPPSPTQQIIEDPRLSNLNLSQKQILQGQVPPPKRDSHISTFELQKQVQNLQFQQKRSSIQQQKDFKAKTSQQNLQKQVVQTEYQIQFQKEFYQQMGHSVNSLLNDPTIIQFSEYMKQLTKTLKDYKKSGQEDQIIDIFVQETSKVLYLAFNREFQSFNFTEQESQQPKQSRLLTYFLLKSIHQHWKHSLSIYHVYIYKKIVKALIEAFPSCEFAFYLAFLDIFKKGFPHFKQMKAWLVQKQREKYVIPVLQKLLGKKFKIHLYQNAQVLKIQ